MCRPKTLSMLCALAVTTMIGVSFSLWSARIWRYTSQPSTSGIMRSSKTRSGLSRRMVLIPSLPPNAPITSKSSRSNISLTRSIMSGSSSMHTILRFPSFAMLASVFLTHPFHRSVDIGLGISIALNAMGYSVRNLASLLLCEVHAMHLES